MKHYLAGNLFSLTDKGLVRGTNEDFAAARLNAFGNVLLLVADGMGGRNKGDYASSYLGNELIKAFLSLDKGISRPNQAYKWIYKTLNRINRELYEKSREEQYSKMGTTLTLALVFKNNLVVAEVGDSRLYILQDKTLTQLSIDQTYAQYLAHNFQITAQAISTHPERHKLTNAVGIRYNVCADIRTYEYHGEALLLCSDGVYNNVSFNELQSVLRGSDTVEQKCHRIIAFGNANGGSDNMAVVIWEAAHAFTD